MLRLCWDAPFVPLGKLKCTLTTLDRKDWRSMLRRYKEEEREDRTGEGTGQFATVSSMVEAAGRREPARGV